MRRRNNARKTTDPIDVLMLHGTDGLDGLPEEDQLDALLLIGRPALEQEWRNRRERLLKAAEERSIRRPIYGEEMFDLARQ